MGFGHHFMTLSGSYSDVLATYKKGDLEETIALCDHYIEYYNDMEISYPIPGMGEEISRIRDIRLLATSGVTYKQNRNEKIFYGVLIIILIAIIAGIFYGIYLGLSQVYDWVINMI